MKDSEGEYVQSRLETLRGPGLIKKGGPYLSFYEHFIVIGEPLAFSFQWLNSNLCVMFDVFLENLVWGPNIGKH